MEIQSTSWQPGNSREQPGTKLGYHMLSTKSLPCWTWVDILISLNRPFWGGVSNSMLTNIHMGVYSRNVMPQNIANNLDDNLGPMSPNVRTPHDRSIWLLACFGTRKKWFPGWKIDQHLNRFETCSHLSQVSGVSAPRCSPIMTPQNQVAGVILCENVPEPDGTILTCENQDVRNHGQHMARSSMISFNDIIQYHPIGFGHQQKVRTW